MGDKIRITYYRSAIGRMKVQKETVRALGFRRLNQTLEKPDNPSIRGMVQKVHHLVRIEEDENGSSDTASQHSDGDASDDENEDDSE